MDEIIKIKKGNCTSFAKVSVGGQKFILLDDFEGDSFYFDEYPDEVDVRYGNNSIDNFLKKDYSIQCIKSNKLNNINNANNLNKSFKKY